MINTIQALLAPIFLAQANKAPFEITTQATQALSQLRPQGAKGGLTVELKNQKPVIMATDTSSHQVAILVLSEQTNDQNSPASKFDFKEGRFIFTFADGQSDSVSANDIKSLAEAQILEHARSH